MADLEFDVAVRRSEPITFTLGGSNVLLKPEVPAKADDPGKPEKRGKDDHVYNFDPPKSAVMLMPVLEQGDGNGGVAMTKSTFDWLGQGLSQEDNDRILNRLKDPKDDLDIDTLSTVIEALSSRVAARPTT
jgi:hypothetical protein